MGLTIQNLENLDPKSRDYLWCCLVASAQQYKVPIVGNYIEGLLEAAGVTEESEITHQYSLDAVQQKLQLMGATAMQVISNIIGNADKFLLKLPEVETYQGITIYADTMPPNILDSIFKDLDSRGLDYRVETGYPTRLPEGPQSSLAIGDDCPAHLFRVGRGLSTLVVAMLRPCYASMTVFDKAIELFTPCTQYVHENRIAWEHPVAQAHCKELMKSLLPMVDIML